MYKYSSIGSEMNILALGLIPDSRYLEPHVCSSPSLYYKSDLDDFANAVEAGQVFEKSKSPLR